MQSTSPRVAPESFPVISERAPRKRAPRTKDVSAPKSPRKRPAQRKRLSPCQRVALCVGSVASFVLLLSVWHCTEAIALLTGSPLILAVLLALGIDAGMVMCEIASICSASSAKRWADRYIIGSVCLSSVLNSVASGAHASTLPVLAYAVGALVPVLVFVLAKVAGHLWTE